MSELSDDLMRQLHYIMRASRYYLYQNKGPISGQKRVLAVLKLADGLSQNYLAEILALKPGSLAELLKKMELKGDITRKTDDQDKRVKRVYLTDSGREKANKLKLWVDKRDTEPFFAGLTEEEQKQLRQLLEKISNNWDDDFKEKMGEMVDPADCMAKFKKWCKYAADHDCSKEELHKMCKHMPKHHHCRPDFDMDDDCVRNYCKFRKMHKYNRDFYPKCWHNENEDL